MHVFGMYVSDMYIIRTILFISGGHTSQIFMLNGCSTSGSFNVNNSNTIVRFVELFMLFFLSLNWELQSFCSVFWYCLLKRLTHTQQCNVELIVGIIINFKIRNSTLQILITPHTTERWKIDHYSLPQKYIARSHLFKLNLCKKKRNQIRR